MTTVEMVNRFLEYDDHPPDSDYTHADHAESLARGLSHDACKDLIMGSCEKLPATIAADIMRGVLSSGQFEWRVSDFLDAIGAGREVSLAAHVIELAEEHTGESSTELSDRLLNRMLCCPDGKMCDRYLFALWSLLRGEVLSLHDPTSVRRDCHLDEGKLMRIYSADHLTDYSRQILDELISSSG